mmetsp:Transcript_19610/g.39749  ORF Transcript_19610/g.39749 Transcript_19610/m.39749 type:complete len:258 (+) Transcript_19610:1490-2263(+)
MLGFTQGPYSIHAVPFSIRFTVDSFVCFNPIHMQWELFDPETVQFYEYKQQGFDGAKGLCTVSSYPHHECKIKTVWRACGRRGRSKIDRYEPPSDALPSSGTKRGMKRPRTPSNYISKSGLSSLELFCGTAGLSVALRRKGVETVTLDHDPEVGADFCMSIAELRNSIEKNTVPAKLNRPFTNVFAAPCCTTFSRASGKASTLVSSVVMASQHSLTLTCLNSLSFCCCSSSCRWSAQECRQRRRTLATGCRCKSDAK